MMAMAVFEPDMPQPGLSIKRTAPKDASDCPKRSKECFCRSYKEFDSTGLPGLTSYKY